MITVNIHQAKTNLSKLLSAVENENEIVTLCRAGKPIAEIVPIKHVKNPLSMHPELQGVTFHYDPTEPLAEDEWPSED